MGKEDFQKRKMSSETMLEKLVDTLMQNAGDGIPAYTLIMGAGASYGAVPTAKQMLGLPDADSVHELSIPLWLAKRRGENFADEPAKLTAVKAFWSSFVDKNSAHLQLKKRALELDGGLPKNTSTSIAAAYQAVFDTSCIGGLDTPERHQMYMRDVTLSVRPTRLNATHFYLASLLSLQRYAKDATGNNGAGDRPLYLGRREFARTLFTTNFDPLLQTSLQLFQLLYYMTDRPELLTADALQTDSHPAIHLFYAHGSVHRPYMAHTEEMISQLKQQNARDLVAYLGTHGVIVLGYSGWDDCLLDALNQTKTFANNLYWLARGEDSVSEKVRDFITSHPNAYWVEIDDGGRFMAQLHGRLCPGAPNTSMLYNPIRPLIQQLECVDLTGIPNFEEDTQPGAKANDSLVIESKADKDVEAIRSKVIHLLNDAEKTFTIDGRQYSSVESRLDQADLRMANKDYEAALKIYNEVLEQSHLLDNPVKGRALAGRGECHKNLGDLKGAFNDFTEVIEMDNPPVLILAEALFDRGYIQLTNGNIYPGIEDVTRFIDISGVNESSCRALYNRAIAYEKIGKVEDAINDYNRIIAFDGISTEQLSRALFNRGVIFGRLGLINDELSDYNHIIKLDGVTVDLLTRTLVNRGVCFGKLGMMDDEINDYSKVIDCESAPVDQLALALINRGFSFGLQDENEQKIRDYTKAIDINGISIINLAQALVERGFSFLDQGKIDLAMGDFKRAVELDDVSPDQLAKALYGSGLCFSKKGKIEEEIGCYTKVIELQDASQYYIAKALINRGVCLGKNGEVDQEISDYNQVIEVEGNLFSDITVALNNRALCYRERGELELAIADCTKIISAEEAPANEIIAALINRGLCFRRQGRADMAIVDFTRVIDSPEASSDQIAEALNNRALSFKSTDDPELEMHDYTCLIEMKNVIPQEIAKALVNRGLSFAEQDKKELAINDLRRALAIPIVPEDLAKLAQNNLDLLINKDAHGILINN